MGENFDFRTLKDLPGVVSRCEVTTREKETLTLTDGLAKAVELVLNTDDNNHKVMIIGNGGSAAIASHQAVDLWKNGGVRATAFNDASLLTCVGNDFGYEELFAQPISQFADRGDLLIAISSSGKSPNITKGVEAARKRGCTVIGFSGFQPGNPLSRLGDLNFYIKSDSYGIVEVGHLWLLHSVIDEVVLSRQHKKQNTWQILKATP